MTGNPQTYRFFLLTMDPVHIGTGGAHLGRVDNPIVREPGTRVPKIPGSSLHGMIRAYAEYRYGKPHCAGQGQQEKHKHCGQPTCPICYTFGFARDQSGGHAGVVAIGDARILLFPVYSMAGPVWITSPSVLKDAGLEEQHTVAPNKARWGGNGSELPTDHPLNLGWLMVERDTHNGNGNFVLSGEKADALPEQIRKRVVLVSDKLFSQIVNSNLEVRTSVSIDPDTGAAKEGALFTYEAIPRATVLWMDVVVNDYREEFPSKERVIQAWEEVKTKWGAEELPEDFPEGKKQIIEDLLPTFRDLRFRIREAVPDGEKKRENFWKNFRSAFEALRKDANLYQESDVSWESPLDPIRSAFEWAEHLGVGGMGTRGFGRIRNLHCQQVPPTSVVKCNGEER